MSTTVSPETAEVTEVIAAVSANRKMDYPVLGQPSDVEGVDAPDPAKLTGTPEDFNYLTHKRINRTYFVDTATYMEHQADILDRKSAALRKEAHEERTAGPMLKAQKKFLAMQKAMAKLAEELQAGGMDTEALLAAAITEVD